MTMDGGAATRLVALCLLAWFAAPAGAGDGATAPRPVPDVLPGQDERIELVSTVIDADPQGAGLPWQPNDSCTDEIALDRARIRFRGLVQERLDWLDERRRTVDQRAGRPLVHVRTRHFELSTDLEEAEDDRRPVRGVAVALLYARRLEDYFDHVVSALHLDETTMRTDRRHQIFLFSSAEPAAPVTREILGFELGSGYKSSLVGDDPSCVLLWKHPKRMRTDAQLHQMLIHAVAHNLYHDVGLYRNWLYESHGWLYEGLAWRDEILLFGPPITGCDPEGTIEFKHWLSPYWEANMRRALRQRRDPDPVAIFALGVEQMNEKHRQFAWSYVDFLMWHDPTKMADLLVAAKGEGKSTPDALQQTYGFDLESFQAGWRAYVQDQCSSQRRDGPTPPRRRGAGR